MNIRIVIPTHGRPGLLRRTLDSLATCRLPAGFRGTLVVENGGKHGAEAICRAAAPHLGIRCLYHETAIKSSALNYALEETGNELLIFLDDDVRLEPQTLCAFASAAEESGRGAFFGGPIQPEFEARPVPWIRLPYSARGWSLPEETREVDWPAFLGFNWAAQAADLCELGGFSTAVGPGGTTGGRGQESEMQQRLLDSGRTGIYVPEALVWHYVPVSRCTVEWSLNRAHQGGISSALLRKQEQLAGKTLQLAWRRMSDMVQATMQQSRPLGYSLRLERAWWAGYALGCFYRLKHSPAPRPPLQQQIPLPAADELLPLTADPESLVA